MQSKDTKKVHPGLMSLQGALASKKGRNLTFAQIREAAAAVMRKERTK